MGNNIKETIDGNISNTEILKSRNINPDEYNKYLSALSNIKSLLDTDSSNPSLKIEIINLLENIKGVDRATDSLLARYIGSLRSANLNDIQGILNNLNSSIDNQILEIQEFRAKYESSRKMVMKSGKWLNELQSSYSQITNKEELENYLNNLKNKNNDLSEEVITEIISLSKGNSNHGEDWFLENDFMENEVDRGEIEEMTINNLRTITIFLQNENNNNNLSITLPGSNEKFEFANLADKLQFINIFLNTLNDGLGDENEVGIFLGALFIAAGSFAAYKIIPTPVKWTYNLFKGLIKMTPVLKKFVKPKDIIPEGGEDKIKGKEVSGEYISKTDMLDLIEKEKDSLSEEESNKRIKLYSIEKLVKEGVIKDLSEIEFGKLLKDDDLPKVYEKSLLRGAKIKVDKFVSGIKSIREEKISVEESLEIEEYLKGLREKRESTSINILGEDYNIDKRVKGEVEDIKTNLDEIERRQEAYEDIKSSKKKDISENEETIKRHRERIEELNSKIETTSSTLGEGKNTKINPILVDYNKEIKSLNEQIEEEIKRSSEIQREIDKIDSDFKNINKLEESVKLFIERINTKLGGNKISFDNVDLKEIEGRFSIIQKILGRIKL